MQPEPILSPAMSETGNNGKSFLLESTNSIFSPTTLRSVERFQFFIDVNVCFSCSSKIVAAEGRGAHNSVLN